MKAQFLIWCIAFVAIAALGGLDAPSVHAEQVASTPVDDESSGGPYCGIYSVYAALQALGIDLPFERLLETKYVGSFYGSSLGELQQAVADFGGTACPMEGMTAASLRSAQHPIILHVRRPGWQTPYAHWVLFLGMDGDKARLLDPPRAREYWDLADLLALWDGTGLVVSKEPSPYWPVQAAVWFDQLSALALVAVVLGVVHGLMRRTPRCQGHINLALLLSLSGAVAVTFHGVREDGMLRNPGAVALVVGKHFKPELPRLSVAEVAALVERPDVTFLDVRYVRDYQRGHLPGAINLPIHAGLVDRIDALARLNPEHLVITYCQSEQCQWAEVIASDLALRGHRKVYLFPGGWQAWTLHVQSTSK